MFFAIHLAFWAVEYVHYQYCVQDFWISILAKHSQPCILLRDLSTATRSMSAQIIAVAFSALTTLPDLKWCVT